MSGKTLYEKYVPKSQCRKCGVVKPVSRFGRCPRDICVDCLDTIIASYKKTSPKMSPVLTRLRHREVYLFSGRNKTKIGIAIDPKARIKVVANNIKEPLTLLFSYKVLEAQRVETFLHHQFSDKRIFSEWFDLSKRDILDIKEYLELVRV